jgi:Fe-S cluster biogenesis protein NfuA
MSCHHVPGGLQDLLDDVWGKAPTQLPILSNRTMPDDTELPARAPSDPSPGGVSPYQFSKQVENIVEHYARPLLQRDGGDVEIVDIKGTLVYCRFRGACAGCSGAAQTMTMMIERPLKDMVDERIRVIQV